MGAHVTGGLLGLVLSTGVLLIVVAFTAAPSTRRRRTESRLSALVRASGVARLSPAGVISACALAGIAGALISLLVTSVPVVALLSGLVCASVPVMLLKRRAAQRERAMAASWADAIDSLVSGIRAGLSLGQALADLGSRGPHVLREPFAAFEADMRVTGSLSAAMDALQAGLADPVADRVLASLRIAQQVGGSDLGGVLRSLGAMLREESRMRGEIDARQSWTVNAARLAVAAPWATLAFLCTRPEAVEAYRTVQGACVLAISAVVCALAYWLMRRIARLPREPRLQP